MKGIAVYLLDEASRDLLLKQFPARWLEFSGHHVTVKFGASDKDPLPPAGKYQVVGYSLLAERRLGGSGIEALVVSIDGNTKREDGNTYHVTWSYGPGYTPKDSVELTATGFSPLDDPIDIDMEPTFIPFN